MDIRTGLGYDVHRLVEGRELWLCGIRIDHTLGLLGHSDADVAIHALGAAALGDIGRHFPDNDDTYKGIDSKLLLADVCKLLRREGWEISNADVTIVAQAPKLAPHIEDMRAALAQCMAVSVDRVSVKATTTERLGFEGRKEGISALATALIMRQ